MAKGNDGQLIVKPSAEGVMASVQAVGKGAGPAPVHLWNPPFCGDLDMRIARDGTWFHEGTPIGRPGMVRMFSNILKLEGGRYYLVTPVERWESPWMTRRLWRWILKRRVWGMRSG
jgi:hypothetical protein